MKLIEWTVTQTDPLEIIRGKKFTGGRVEKMNGIRVVKFESPLVGGKHLCARVDTRPELAALADEFMRRRAAQNTELEARWAAKKAEDEAIDKPLREDAEKQAAEIRASIPAGNIPVKVEKVGSTDGDPIYDYYADGIKINWNDCIHHGTASAIRPGALGAFFVDQVYSIPRARLDEIKAERAAKDADAAAKKRAAADERAAKFAEAARTGKPVALRSWTETRRAKEGGEWGDYLFGVTEYAMPDGSTKQNAVNTY